MVEGIGCGNYGLRVEGLGDGELRGSGVANTEEPTRAPAAEESRTPRLSPESVARCGPCAGASI